MEGFRPSEGPPASQVFPLFYIYRRLGHPVPLIPLDELPLWLLHGEGDWWDPWWLKDSAPEKKGADGSLHKKESLPENSGTALVSSKDQKDIFLRLLDPESRDEILRNVYRYVPQMIGPKLENFPFNNEFMRRMMESRCGEFKPKTIFYDPECPVQQFYLGQGLYPYLWGVFGEVISFLDNEPLPPPTGKPTPKQRKRRKATKRRIMKWLSGKDPSWGYIPSQSAGVVELLLDDAEENDPSSDPSGLSLDGVLLRKTISAPEYLTTGPLGGRPEGLSEGVSHAAGIAFLRGIMGIADAET